MPGLLLLAGFLVNAAAWRSPGFGLILAAAFVFVFGAQVGRAVAPDEHPVLRWWQGAWMLLSALMLVGAAAYYLHSFPDWLAWTLALLIPPVAFLAMKRSRPSLLAHDAWSDAPHRIPPAVLACASGALLALAIAFRVLVDSATVEAVASPWRAVAPAAFAAMAAAGAFLAALWSRGRERLLSVVLASAAVFTFVSVPWTVFPLGTGFDPFIHQAAERLVVEHGAIEPKQPYYVGQYVLVAFLHHAFALPVEAADRFLLPLLAALLLPFAWMGAALHVAKDRRHAAFALFGLFLLPLAGFAITTPQGLANLWILLLVPAAVPALARDERPGPLALFLPALAALAIHPVAGLPALLFAAYLAADPRRVPRLKAAWAAVPRGVIVGVGAVLLPLAFAVLAWQTGQPAFQPDGALARLAALVPRPPVVGFPFRPFLDFAVWAGWLAGAAWLALSAYGWRTSGRPLRLASLAFAGMMLVNGVLLAAVTDFSFLIDYERLNYADRLLPLALFGLAPLAVAGLVRFSARLTHAPAAVRILTLAVAAAALPALWYAAYPRDDAYQKGHGYNVSAANVEAVRLIEQRAEGPYVALAHQSVSAAALTGVGFRYYGDQFFYPIPTGGHMYALFLDMNADPSRETAWAAAAWAEERCGDWCEYGRIREVYYVVDDYWWDAPAIVARAKETADEWFAVRDGRAHVFRYAF